ncbi:GTP-binding protein [uncultured Allofournierella sp.]|uniref:TIGR03943 family putative permease subunit n=1 Tax=uncultured Allofournierella sp. TaxID=1940258 RepID=UPI003752E8B9
MRKDIPVYLFLGFLESGKTRFIQETMEDPKFDSGDKTLLLVCEEGEEEYAPDRFAFGGVTVEVLESQEQLNPEYLEQLIQRTGAGRVVVEYNGMWLTQQLAQAMPDNWVVYQTIATADASTFRMYFDNMRQLFLDKFSQSELLIVNRAEAVNNPQDKEFIHKAVRQASRRCDIAYEYTDGSVEYDQIPDELPFDLEAPVVEIEDEDYGIWFLDASEDPEKYAGKTVRFTAQVCQTPKVGQNQFVPGRFAMTCCADDIQFVGFPCKYDEAKKLAQRSWIKITAKVRVQFHPLFGGKGPVLTALEVESTTPLQQDVVTFS